MRLIFGFGVAVFSCAVLLPADITRANAQETDGPSRSELFSRFVRGPAEAGLGALSSALPLLFRFPTHVRDDGIFGIDVSHHNEDTCNCKIDWNAVGNQKISFAYMKATQGALFRDSKFDNNWTALAQHPTIYRGAYHFLSSAHDPVDQAKNFLAKIGPMQSKDMPPCLDIEWDMVTVDGQQSDSWIRLSPEEIVDRALKWLNHVEAATGRVPIIYTSSFWWKNRIKDDKTALFHRYHIWIADYSEKGLGQEIPSVPSGSAWKIWQFTEKGVLDQGLPGQVDVNIFKGSMDDFRQTFGLAVAAVDPKVPGPSGGAVTPNPNPIPAPNTDAKPGAPGGSNVASGGANTPSATPTTNTTSTPKRTSAKKSDSFDVFGNRGGRDVPIE